MKNIPKYKWILVACAIAMALVGLLIINLNKLAVDSITLIVGIVTLVVGIVRLVYGIVLCRKEKDFYYQVIFGALSMVFGMPITLISFEIFFK